MLMLKRKILAQVPVLLDGGTATEMQRLGMSVDAPTWTTKALLSPEGKKVLLNIHKNYINAGADIITTNTFRTNARSVRAMNIKIDESALVDDAVSIAREAISQSDVDRKVYVAGCVAPIGDAYKPQDAPDPETMRIDHQKSIDHLINSGVDLILAETMNTWTEASIITQLCHNNIPVMLSYTCSETGMILGEQSYAGLVEIINLYQPLLVSVNCTSIAIARKALDKLSSVTTVPLGVYPNIEDRSEVDGHVDAYLKPAITKYQFVEFMRECVKNYRLSLVGGCCGSTPEHITVLREHIDQHYL